MVAAALSLLVWTGALTHAARAQVDPIEQLSQWAGGSELPTTSSLLGVLLGSS
jgi:hypothetical protein